MNSQQPKQANNGIFKCTALMLRSFQAVLTGFLVLAVEKISADTCTLYPIADTYISEVTPNDNYGAEVVLCAGYRTGVNSDYTEAFFAFDTAGAIPANAVITRVQLKLYEFTKPADLGYSLTIFSSRPFSENSLTWNTRPSALLPDGTYGNHGTVGRPSNGQWVFDSVGAMVSYLQRDLNSGSKTYYRIGSGNSFDGLPPFFYSREWSASQAYHPRLVVTYTIPKIVITVRDQEGNVPTGISSRGRLVRYRADWHEIDQRTPTSSGTVTYTLSTDNPYNFEFYYNGPNPFDTSDEFWGGILGISSDSTLQRHQPYCESVRFFRTDTGAELPRDGSGTVPRGVSVRCERTIRNKSASTCSTRLTSWIDRDKSSAIDYSSEMMRDVGGNGAQTLISTFRPAPGGYHHAVKVETSFDGRYVKTDSWDWGAAFTVIPDSSTGVNATDGAIGQVTITWDSTACEGYYIERSTVNNYDTAKDIAHIPSAQTTSYVDKDAEPGQRYYYWVIAYVKNACEPSLISYAIGSGSSDSGYCVAESVSTPATPTGPSSGFVGQSLSFSTGSSTCNAGHGVEYQFDWGDGTQSSWGGASRTHSYGASGRYNINTRARCAVNTSIVSGWSGTKSVTVSYCQLSVSANPSGSGSISKNPDNAAGYSYGQSVSLTAVAAGGYVFAGWSGDLSGTANPGTIQMTGNKSVTANFKGSDVTVTFDPQGGSVTPTSVSGTPGQQVALPTPTRTGYSFGGWWTGMGGTGSQANSPYTLSDNSLTLYAKWTSSSVSATQTTTGYQSPGQCSVVCTVNYPASRQLTALLCRPTLPSGWTLSSVSGDGSPEIQLGEIVFTGTLQNNPIRFTYVCAVPSGHTGEKQIASAIEYQLDGMANPSTVWATPNPLTANPGTIYHTADYRTPYWVIDGTEVNRVLSYWRAGAYRANAAGADGYVAGTSGSMSAPYHKADYRSSYWVIDGTEVNRVLSYWRSGGYHVDAAGADGYAPGSAAPAPASAFAIGDPQMQANSVQASAMGSNTGALQNGTATAHHQVRDGVATYTPGGTVVIEGTFTFGETITALLWRPILPAGWTIASVAGDGNPECNYGEIVWTGTLPPSPITLSYTVNVSASATGNCDIRDEVEYTASGAANPVTVYAAVDPLVLSGSGGGSILSVTPATRPVSKGAGATTFNVANTGSGTMSWTTAVTSGGAWARIISGASGVNAGTFTVGFDANPPGGAQRTATIRVTAPGATGSPTDVRVVQEANFTAPTITTSSPLPVGTAGSAYSVTLAASGGTTPYTWSRASGSLPVGLNLSGGGVISGTPTASGTSSFTVRVTDGNNLSSTKAFSLTINAPEEGLVFSENWESGQIDTGKWKIWGYPAPTIVSGGNSIGNYALTSNGDSMYESGVTSLRSFEVKPGLTVSAKVFVQAPGTDVWSKRSWHGLALSSRPPAEWGDSCGAGDALIGPFINIRGNTPTDTGLAVTTPSGGKEYASTPYLDKWTTIAFTFNTDGSVTYRVNGQVLHTTSAGWINYGNVPVAYLVCGGRSEGSSVVNLHDDIMVRLSSADRQNVALAVNGGIASAGSVGTYMSVSHPAANANDGDVETEWCNSWSMPDWLMVEFNQTYLIDRVGVVWGIGTHNQTFSISLSADGNNWTTVVTSRSSATDAGYNGSEYHGNTTVSRETFPITPMFARFIKIDVTASSAPQGHIFKAIVHELQAFQAANPDGGTGDDPDDAGYLCDPAGDATLMTIGSYDGYFYATDAFGGAEEASAVRGTLSLKVTHLVGKLTAKATLQGGNVSFKGEAAWRMADGTRRAELTASGGEKLVLFIRQNRIWGTLTGGRAGAATLMLDGARNRFADRGDTEAAARLEEFKGYYTVALPAVEDGAVSATAGVDAAPQGAGYLTLTVRARGAVRIAGVLADGTRVSRTSRLILFDGCGPEACVPLFAPLYSKKGWVGGLLWIDPETRTVETDRDLGWFIRWENPGRVGPDGFSLLLDACGGFYGTGASLAAAYLFGAEVDNTAYFAAGEPQEWAVWPEATVTGAGNRLTVTKGAKPRKHSEYGDVWYEYDDVNPANATFSFTSRTGIFRGKFSLYCDYEDATGRLVHKAVSVPYAGVLTPLRSEAFTDLPAGLGYCLIPDNDPAVRAFRLKRSRLVWLEESK